MDSVTILWQRIDAWFQNFAPTRAADLLPGVTPEELGEAEARLGLTLPADFKASYRMHNGAGGHGYLLMGYPDFYPLAYVHSFAEIFRDHLQDPNWAGQEPGFVSDHLSQSLPMQPVWCPAQWVTFAGDGSGYQWCIDLAPAPGGKWGQVTAWDHEYGPAAVLFPDFVSLLATYADQLEAGLYLGHSPIIALGKLTHLQERRAAYQQPTAGKPLLQQAMRIAWEEAEDIEKSLDIFKQVLNMESATPEDRFFAYYGLITWCWTEMGYSDEIPSLFAQWEAEARALPSTHWVHEEVALMKPLSL